MVKKIMYFKNKQNFKPYFKNPYNDTKIYKFFDACHMIKLIRNYFGERRIFFRPGDNCVKWSFIMDLHLKQKSDGLHCACKIRRHHVFYHREKIKVCLAAQLWSSSTTKTLKFLDEELHDPQF